MSEGARSRFPALTFATAFLALLAFANGADACSCLSSGPPCQSLFQVDAVFVGTVRSISPIDVSTNSPPYTRHMRVVSLTMERAVRGVQGTMAEVLTGNGGGDCGYEFKVGEQYVVYAYRASGDSRLQTGICSRTKRAADAAEDLRYFDSLPASGPGATVYGTVTHNELDPATRKVRQYPPIPFAHVMLRGPRAFEAQTDEQGRYSITGVPPGTYELQMVPPAAFGGGYGRPNLELRDARACAVENFYVRYNGRITGVVLDADGGPAADVPVQAIAADAVGATGPVLPLRARAGPGGYYEFTWVSPGRYLVGVDLVREMERGNIYPRTYYPGTSTSRDAAIVTIGEGTHEALEPLRLQRPRSPRELTGVVVWPDGRPAAGVTVSLSDGEARWRQVGVGVRTDADGRFTLPVRDGLSYIASAFTDSRDDPTHPQARANAGPFVASAQTAPLRLVLSRPGDR